MYGGRAGRGYITRNQPDNRGRELGTVVGSERGELIVEVRDPILVRDGLGFEPPDGVAGDTTGFQVSEIRTMASRDGVHRQAIATRVRVPEGWRVVRSSEAALLERARASYAALAAPIRQRKTRIDVRVFGTAGAPLKAVFTADGESVTVRSEPTLAPATARALATDTLREQLGRLGDTPFVLGALDISALGAGLFLPVSALNRLRQDAVEELLMRRDWAREAAEAERDATIDAAIASIDTTRAVEPPPAAPFALRVAVFTLDDARAAAEGGATEIVFDPFLRHPAPPRARIIALRDELAARGVAFRLRTPSIVRPEERPQLQKWLDLGTPLLSGHLGLVAELGGAGRDVVADYAVNCFNQHTAAELFKVGASRVTLSLELTADEMRATSEPWSGAGFDVFLYGRPEGMTIEHCVLSAAFDREPTTCRDLCVQKHTNVLLTDPTGYTFPVATDSACRNRLLHSRPVDGSEYLPRLWGDGIRGYQVVFNVAGDAVAEIVRRYRAQLDALAAGAAEARGSVRDLLGAEFTRGHFARAV